MKIALAQIFFKISAVWVYRYSEDNHLNSCLKCIKYFNLKWLAASQSCQRIFTNFHSSALCLKRFLIVLVGVFSGHCATLRRFVDSSTASPVLRPVLAEWSAFNIDLDVPWNCFALKSKLNQMFLLTTFRSLDKIWLIYVFRFNMKLLLQVIIRVLSR